MRLTVRFEFRPYRRRFRKPLITARGRIDTRSGFVIRLIDRHGKEAFGEAAPWPEMGSESLEECAGFLRQIGPSLDEGALQNLPGRLPACRFGLSTAWDAMQREGRPVSKPFAVAALLRAGKEAMEDLAFGLERGFRVFKWKIGVMPVEEEQAVFRELRRLAPDARFRLDANGGLSPRAAGEWVRFLAGEPVEFLEQPFPPSRLRGIMRLAGVSPVPLALDESVGNWRDWEKMREAGWRGRVVLKPSVFGSVSENRHIIRDVPVVLSSVFETGVGVESILSLAGEMNAQEALGLGTASWFEEDGLNPHGTGPFLRGGQVDPGLVWRLLE